MHRRLRPEVMAERVDRTLNAGAGYPVHPEILNSFNDSNRLKGFMPAGNALLPMAFPEGSPTHPAYGAGHATEREQPPRAHFVGVAADRP